MSTFENNSNNNKNRSHSTPSASARRSTPRQSVSATDASANPDAFDSDDDSPQQQPHDQQQVSLLKLSEQHDEPLDSPEPEHSSADAVPALDKKLVAQPGETIDIRGKEISFDGPHAIQRYPEFDDMELRAPILRSVYAYGYEKPSPVQQLGIVAMRDGEDIIVQANSGTGKTATFTVGTLEQIDFEATSCGPQALFLCPTRELSVQTAHVVKALGMHLDVRVHACVGGTRVSDDRRVFASRHGPHVVVGTPGRVLHMATDGALDLSDLRVFVMDEADELMDRGFRDQIYDVFQFVPENTQVGLFSATMPEEALEVSNKFMRNPLRLLIKREQITLNGIKQYFVADIQEHHKFEVLLDLYSRLTITQAIIYCNTRRRVQELAEQLNAHDFTCSCIHSLMESSERSLVMQEFRSGQSRVLISTDLTARGIDVRGVSLVINYDLPHDYSFYIHRIGRSGRFGRKGVAINLVTDDAHMAEIAHFYQTEVKPLPGLLDGLLD